MSITTSHETHSRVVALVNGSHRSERSVGVAVELANRMNRPLTLMTANAAPFTHAMRERHEVLMAEHPGMQADSVLAESSGGESTVLMRCLRSDDIVVIAADHVSIAGELFEGSVFMNLLRAFPGVLVAVGPKATLPASASAVLVCVDDQSDEQLRLLTEFADPASLSPELISVIALDSKSLGDSVDSGWVHQLAASWNKRRPGALAAGWEVLYGDAVDAIESYANHDRVAAIGLVSMGLGALGRIVSPSLANNLLHRSPRPLVLLSEPPKQVVHHLGR
jgi:hypothetical protein